MTLAVKLNIIQKSGAWFSYGDTRLGQGRDNTKLYLEEHPGFAADIEAQVRDHAERAVRGPRRQAPWRQPGRCARQGGG